MNLIELALNNFRRYDQALMRLHPRFTVLIGDNGQGKTTILDAIAFMLNTYFQNSGINTGITIPIKKEDARLVVSEKGGQVFFEPEQDVSLRAKALLHGEEIEWIREIGDRGGKAKQLTQIGKKDRESLKSDPELPLLLYYGSGRLWDVHRKKIETEKPSSQLDAYRFCLDPKSDQKSFEKWFKKLSLVTLQKKCESPALSTVQQAVCSCIPDASDFYHDAEYDQSVIKLKSGDHIFFNNLSDGYRNMVAMVADIAHRASRLNPHHEDKAAIQTQGIVLIDEIDLHLHPKWQRHVVRDLKQAFPQIQFIATTHSPFIVQSLEPGEVIDLNQSSHPDQVKLFPANTAAPGPTGSHSDRSIEDITEEIMGIVLPQRSQRQQEMYKVAKQYYHLLQYAKESSEDEREDLKARLDALSAPFSENVAYHAFLEMERLATGLGRSKLSGED